MEITHVGFDADDTLWRNEDNFLFIGEKFRQALGPEFNEVSKKFYEIEGKNLRFFGYGAKGFILSMIETALELTNHQPSGALIEQIIGWGKEMLAKQIELLPGVLSTIKDMQRDFTLVMITKGDLFEQEVKVARSMIADEFDHIHIVSEKNEERYAKILAELKIETQQFLMVGNSLKSDIAPVVRLGAKAIHIPYDTTWVQEILGEEERARIEYYTLSKIAEVPSFVRHLNAILSHKVFNSVSNT